ncbi:MAG: hypothetical protein VX764_09170 [Planctomycetota bacterium]|nr:hypothetical protein [Planctomycetota bacterium]
MGFLTSRGKSAGFLLSALVLLIVTPVTAQVPFDECGIFVADPAGSCPLFAPYALPGNYLVDLGTLPIPPVGTEARISGTLEDCVATCFPMGCIFNATLDPSCGGPPPPPQPEFIRGDCNNDASFNIADVIFHLNGLFAAGSPPACQNACDFNGDQTIDIGDAIVMLMVLFQGGGPPPPPWPDCGVDPTQPTSPDCLNPICP